MATVKGLTAAQMLLLQDSNIVGATVNSFGNLILITRGGATIDAGSVTLPGGDATKYYRGDNTWQILDKSAVGLSLVDNVSVIANYVPKWKTGATYAVGDKVVSPGNQVLTANTAHTASASILTDIAKWDLGLGPGGLMAIAEMTTSSGAIGAATVVANIPSFTFKANRRYRLLVSGNYYASGINSSAVFSIYSCPTADAASATTNLTAIRQLSDRPNVASEGRNVLVLKEGHKYTSDTTLQIKYVIERVSGGDGFFSSASTSSPLSLAIYDEGMQV